MRSVSTSVRQYVSTSARLVRRLLASIRGQRTMLRWCAEIAGVGAIAYAAWTWHEALGVVVVGAYLVIVANAGGE